MKLVLLALAPQTPSGYMKRPRIHSPVEEANSEIFSGESFWSVVCFPLQNGEGEEDASLYLKPSKGVLKRHAQRTRFSWSLVK